METIRQALLDMDRARKSWNGSVFMCYSPRHCLRVATASGTYELLICYECSEVKVFKAEGRIGEFFISTEEKGQSATPAKLNSLLLKHAIPLPPAP